MKFTIMPTELRMPRRERIRYRCEKCGDSTVYPEDHAWECGETRFWSLA